MTQILWECDYCTHKQLNGHLSIYELSYSTSCYYRHAACVLATEKRALQKINVIMYIMLLCKHLCYFNHNFRLSQLHQCDHGMLTNT